MPRRSKSSSCKAAGVAKAFGATLEQSLLRIVDNPSGETQHLTDMEANIMSALALRWVPVIRAFAEAPSDVREKVHELQAKFADPNSAIARAVAQLAQQLHRAEFFAGLGTDPDDIAAGGLALTEAEIAAVMTVNVVNAADTMPDGSEALFYLGALMEHSCTPNVKLCVYASQQAPQSKGKHCLPAGSWVFEWQALCALREGQAVCSSYLEREMLEQSHNARRHKLYARMGFWCSCMRCQDESRPASDTSKGFSLSRQPSVAADTHPASQQKMEEESGICAVKALEEVILSEMD